MRVMCFLIRALKGFNVFSRCSDCWPRNIIFLLPERRKGAVARRIYVKCASSLPGFPSHKRCTFSGWGRKRASYEHPGWLSSCLPEHEMKQPSAPGCRCDQSAFTYNKPQPVFHFCRSSRTAFSTWPCGWINLDTGSGVPSLCHCTSVPTCLSIFLLPSPPASRWQ